MSLDLLAKTNSLTFFCSDHQDHNSSSFSHSGSIVNSKKTRMGLEWMIVNRTKCNDFSVFIIFIQLNASHLKFHTLVFLIKAAAWIFFNDKFNRITKHDIV